MTSHLGLMIVFAFFVSLVFATIQKDTPAEQLRLGAKMFGMFPKKGTIAVGSDADIVLFDPEKEHVFGVEHEHMNVDYSAYEGWRVKGKVETVLSRGRVVIENGECLVEKGSGEFVKRGECVKI